MDSGYVMAERVRRSAEILSGDDNNPVTGMPANSFTQANRKGEKVELPAPQKAKPLPESADAAHMRQTREAHERGASDLVGWDLRGFAEPYRAHLSGVREMYPNVSAARGNSAINEPHEVEQGVPVRRRAEDLSGSEYRQGEQILREAGFRAEDPVGHLTEVKKEANYRTAARNNQAGVNENSIQHFYGGAPITTRLHDPELQAAHEKGMRMGGERREQSIQPIASHPKFQEATRGMSERERRGAATNMMAQATADTSPNLKWFQPLKSGGVNWPNYESGDKGVRAALEGGEPETGGQGFYNNRVKARNNTARMMETGDYDASASAQSPKTGPFRGALIEPHSEDAFTVLDLHEGNSNFPGFSPAKSNFHKDESGKRVERFPDQPDYQDAGRELVRDKDAKIVQGSSRGEQMTARGGEGLMHSMNDYAARRANFEMGISRSVSHSDNVHPTQAGRWGGEQVGRPDIPISHAHLYPVVENHRSGDISASDMLARAKGDEAAHGRVSHFMAGQISSERQYTRNPHTSLRHDPSTDRTTGGYLT